MTKKRNEELEVPVGFPDNVSPSKENIDAFNKQREADEKALDEGGKGIDYTEARIGEAIRDIPVDERQPEASPDGKSQVRQTKTVNKG